MSCRSYLYVALPLRTSWGVHLAVCDDMLLIKTPGHCVANGDFVVKL